MRNWIRYWFGPTADKLANNYVKENGYPRCHKYFVGRHNKIVFLYGSGDLGYYKTIHEDYPNIQFWEPGVEVRTKFDYYEVNISLTTTRVI